MLDPVFAIEEDGTMKLPHVPISYQEEAATLIERIGGASAGEAFQMLLLGGWLKQCTVQVKALVNRYAGNKRSADGEFRGRAKMPPMGLRIGVWERFCKLPELEDLEEVAQRLLRAHRAQLECVGACVYCV